MLSPSKKVSRGFTLIELLVVIAIIVLLVSILVPSLRKAKDLANSAVCMSTQRGTAYALMMYCQDIKRAGYCVIGNWKMPDTRGGSDTWVEWLKDGDYISGMPAIQCPSWKVGRQWQYGSIPEGRGYTGMDDDPFRAFGLRTLDDDLEDLTGGDNYTQPFLPKRPGECPWGADSVSIKYNGGDYHQYFVIDGWGSQVTHLRHVGRANLFYVDGHVESRDADALDDYGWKGETGAPHYMFNYMAYTQNCTPVVE